MQNEPIPNDIGTLRTKRGTIYISQLQSQPSICTQAVFPAIFQNDMFNVYLQGRRGR